MSACLYRVRDADGVLVYVGSSMSAWQRLSAHAAGAEWWCEAHTVEIEHFDSRDAARRAETEAIRTEDPRSNRLRPGMKTRRRQRRSWVVVSLSLPLDEHAFIKALAKANQRSMSAQIRYLVSQLEDPNAKPAEKAA